jgi:hypothetical protein
VLTLDGVLEFLRCKTPHEHGQRSVRDVVARANIQHELFPTNRGDPRADQS